MEKRTAINNLLRFNIGAEKTPENPYLGKAFFHNKLGYAVMTPYVIILAEKPSYLGKILNFNPSFLDAYMECIGEQKYETEVPDYKNKYKPTLYFDPKNEDFPKMLLGIKPEFLEAAMTLTKSRVLRYNSSKEPFVFAGNGYKIYISPCQAHDLPDYQL